MKPTTVLQILAALTLMALPLTALAAIGRPAAGPNLDRIKALAGDWYALGEDGKPSDQLVSSVKITAGGSAVREILFPGTDHEMVTMYYMKGEVLHLTHYCVLGNQPRMTALADADAGALVFVCTKESGIRCDVDKHMHQGTLRLVSENHVQSEWLMLDQGEVGHTASFDLVRKKS